MRRNLLVIYMSLELMLNAANLALVSFSRFNNKLDGQVLVFFIITVAAAEVAVGLALIVALYRKRQSAHVEDLTIDETLTDETTKYLPWLILFLPLLSAAVITLFTLRSKTVSSLISIGAVVAGFVMTLVFINANGFQFSGETSVNWLSIGGSERGLRPQARRLEHDDAAGRHRRRRRDSYLFLRLHGRRPRARRASSRA